MVSICKVLITQWFCTDSGKIKLMVKESLIYKEKFVSLPEPAWIFKQSAVKKVCPDV